MLSNSVADRRHERRPPQAAGPPPGQETLHEAALRHLARYATTAAGLRRVLNRRIDRWSRLAAQGGAETDTDVSAARQAADAVVADLVRAGAVDDAAFAAARARSLARAGRSQQAIAAHLLSRGIAATLVQSHAASSSEADDVAAALALARRRRIGPYRVAAVDEGGLRRELGVLARAGFSRHVADVVLKTPLEEAELRVRSLRAS